MPGGNTIALIAVELVKIWRPLEQELADEQSELFLRSLGLRPPQGFLQVPALATAMSGAAAAAGASWTSAVALTVALSADGDPDVAIPAAELLASCAALAVTLEVIETQFLAAAASYPGLTAQQQSELTDFGNSLLGLIRDRLIADALRARSPYLSSALLATGVMAIDEVLDGGPNSLHVAALRRRFELDHLTALLRDPLGHLRSLYGWGRSTFDGVALFAILKSIFDDHGIPAEILAPPGMSQSLEAMMLRLDVANLSPPGLGIALRFPANLTLSDTMTVDDWQMPIQATLQFEQDVELQLAPPLALTVASTGSSPLQAALSAEATRSAGGTPVVLAGDAGGSRLEATSSTVGVTVDTGSVAHAAVPLSLRLHGKLQGGQLVLDPSSDSFVQRVLGGNKLSTSFDLDAAWTPDGGLTLSGKAGLEVDIPVRATLGPVRLDSLHAGLVLDGNGLVLELSITAGADLGPISVTLDRFGLIARAASSDGGGNVGFAHIDLGWLPPHGAAIVVKAGPITGGGSLSIDATAGTYQGALQLDMFGYGLTALALATTRPSFSFLMVLSIDLPGIPLGLGFTLDGVGGLVAIDRRSDPDSILSAIRGGHLDDVFFARNPVAQSARLLTDLATYFPRAPGRYIFGPAAKIGWGTPRVFEGDVAVLLELPAPIRVVLLASLELGLPDLDHRIVDLRIAALGVLDLDRDTLAVDASLHDSKISSYPLTGDLALRLGWGNDRDFACAIGGFHPQFQPPPGFPTLRRLALTAGDNPQLRLSCYLALTSNTAQVGAQADLTASGDGFDIAAHVGFDALFQFVPFQFSVEITASASISWHGHDLLGVSLDFLLTGPHPWHAKGDATFSILWWDVSVGFDHTWGDATPAPLPPPPDIADALRDALGRDDAWSGQLPPGERSWLVLASGTPQAKLHPCAALVVRERAVPLDYPITEFGNIPLAAVQQLSISSVQVNNTIATTVATTTTVTDAFAPGQFSQLSDDERLVAPGFESLHSGVAIGADLAVVGGVGRASMDVVTSVEDPLAPPTRPPIVVLPVHVAIAAAALRSDGTPSAPAVPTGPRFGEIPYVLASTNDLTVTSHGTTIAGGATSFAGTREALRMTGDATLQVVTRAEVAS